MPDAQQPTDRSWDPPPDWADFRLELPGLTAAVTDPGPLAFANGDVARARARAGIGVPAVGWPGPAMGPVHAVTVARDRCLIVGAGLADGWHEDGFGVTDVTDGFVCFTLEGPGLQRALLALGEVHLDRPSPSAAHILAGLRALLYLTDRPDRLRVLIARPSAAAFASLLRIALGNALDGVATRAAGEEAARR